MSPRPARGPCWNQSREQTARLILDTLGAAVAAHSAAGISGIRGVIEGWGGRSDATFIGARAWVPAHNAALVNSALPPRSPAG